MNAKSNYFASKNHPNTSALHLRQGFLWSDLATLEALKDLAPVNAGGVRRITKGMELQVPRNTFSVNRHTAALDIDRLAAMAA